MSDITELDNLPPVVIRTLAHHGPLDVASVGSGSTAKLPCAPFENVVHLFVNPGSATETGLLHDPRLHLVAKAPDGAYTLRMSGRAHAGVAMNRHPARASLEAWAPGGVGVHRLLVVPFVAEELEFVQGDGEEQLVHTGRTPRGLSRGSMLEDAMRAAFSGMAAPMAVWSVVASTAWLGAQGADYPGRILALCLAIVAALALIGSLRLLVVAQGFMAWRAGRGRERDAPVLRQGLLAPLQVRRFAATGLCASAVAFGTMATIWGSSIVLLVIGLSGIWLVGPAWLVHMFIPSPEARD